MLAEGYSWDLVADIEGSTVLLGHPAAGAEILLVDIANVLKL